MKNIKVFICIANENNPDPKPGTVHIFVDKEATDETYKARIDDPKDPWTFFNIAVPELLYKLMPVAIREGLEGKGFQLN